jgi:8-oxo-dGTP diphosphatase
MIPSVIAPVPSTGIIAAGLILRRATTQGDRWLLLRARKHREWGFPKGHQEPGETLLAAALRECAEECGIGLVAVEDDPLEIHYLLPNGRAKKAIYFPAITAEATVRLSQEHDDYAWLSAAAAIARLPHANLVLLFRAHLHALRRRTASHR